MVLLLWVRKATGRTGIRSKSPRFVLASGLYACRHLLLLCGVTGVHIPLGFENGPDAVWPVSNLGKFLYELLHRGCGFDDLHDDDLVELEAWKFQQFSISFVFLLLRFFLQRVEELPMCALEGAITVVQSLRQGRS